MNSKASELILFTALGIAGMIAMAAGDDLAKVIGAFLSLVWIIYLVKTFPQL